MQKVLSTLLIAIMLLSMNVTVFAKDNFDNNISVTIDSETDVTIVIPNIFADEIGYEEINNLINSQSFSDGDIITVIEIGSTITDEIDTQPVFFYPMETALSNEFFIQPCFLNRIETTLSWGDEYKAQDYFIISAAKGQTTTLTSKFSQTLTTNFSVGDEAYAKTDIGGSLTAEYTTSHQFVGPSESSIYNSREFRVQFYAKPVDWIQTKYNIFNNFVGTRSGTAYVPTKYLLYSIDHRI